MESDARYAWVGAAMLVLIAVLAGGMYWLKNSRAGDDTERYLIYFREQSLEGLQINSDVRMQGIRVGRVVDYIILPNQAQAVRVLIEVDARTPVLEGVEAVVTRHLVTGLAAVDLENVWKGGTPLQTVPEGEPYSVIDEGVPQMARLARSLEDLGGLSQEAVGRFNTLLSDANQRALALILQDMATISAEMRVMAPAFGETLRATRDAALRVDQLSGEITPLLHASDTLLRHAGDELKRLGDASESTLQATRATLASLDSEMRETSLRLRVTADLGLQEWQATARNLRAAGDGVQAGSRAFSNPERLLYGPHPDDFGPGER